MSGVAVFAIDFEILRCRIAKVLRQECKWLEPFKEYPEDFDHMTFVATLEHKKVFVRIRRHRHSSVSLAPTSMESEIATIKYVGKHTNIPVPKVLAYHADRDQHVGGEWMVTEHINGTSLLELWPRMTHRSHELSATNIAKIWTTLLNIKSKKIGSIYELREGQFYVGPVAFMPPTNRITRGPDPNKCGPFTSSRAWLMALAKHDLDDWEKFNRKFTPIECQRMDNVLHDIRTSTSLDQDPISSPNLSRIGICHMNMDMKNILVDPERPWSIVGIIGWEGARTMPLWAMRPRMLFEPSPLVINAEEIDWRNLVLNAIKIIDDERKIQSWNTIREEGTDLCALLARAESSTEPVDTNDG